MNSNWSNTHIITPILQDLPCLPVKQHIHFKLPLFTFKAIHNLGAPYLSHLLYIAPPAGSLRSSYSLWPPRSFQLLWNSRPPDIHDSHYLPGFKSRLSNVIQSRATSQKFSKGPAKLIFKLRSIFKWDYSCTLLPNHAQISVSA